MKKIALVALTVCTLVSCQGQITSNKTSEKVNVLKTEDIKDIVTFLASDELNGRDTGTEDIDKAASYIQDYFKKNKVKPYFEEYRDQFSFNARDKEYKGFNVVGVVEGNDKDLKNEYIVIGAHYDHIGFGKAVAGDSISNGANDNATGTAVVMNLAKYFAETNSNKRSVIFALFSAEEKGLRGSAHLAERLKSQNIDLYTMINFEMLGVPFKDRDYEVFLTGYDKSNFAEVFNEYAESKIIGFSEVSKKYGLYRRSDNYAFVKEFNVPSHTISSCDLTNFDHYHKVTDEVEELDFDFMSKVVKKMVPGLEKLVNTPTKEILLNEE